MKRLLLIAFMATSFVGARAQTVSAEVAGPLELSNGLVEDQLFGAGELEGTLTAVEITATYTYASNAFMQANDLGIFVLNGPTTILQAGGYSQMVIDGEKIDWTNGNTTATPTTFTDMKTLVTPITFTANDNHTVYVGNGNAFGSGTWESITVTLHGVSLVEEEPVSAEKHQQTKLSLYPNPSRDVLNITCGNETIETVKITDLNGKVVKDIKTEGLAVQVNIADLAAGTYIVTVSANGKSNTEKFVRK